MSSVTNKSNLEVNPGEHVTERNQLDKSPPCSSCCTSSPKTQELRTRYEALHPAENDLKFSKPDQER